MEIYRCLLFLILSLVFNEGRSLNKNKQGSLGRKSAAGKSRHRAWKDSLSEKHGNETFFTEKKPLRETKSNKDAIVGRKKTTKSSKISSGDRKSTIDIHENLARTPVIYNSPNGKDYYVYVKTKPQQPAQTVPVSSQPSTVTQIAPRLPSKTFLVTVFGEHLTGVEDKIRQALAKPPTTTARPCSCPCCQCACKSRDLLKNADCSCEKTSKCPCEEENEKNANNNSKDGSMVILFPNGAQHHNGPCVCPCCMCSCSEPGYESYDCGCQKSPPVPCPCSSSSITQTQSTPVMYSDPNCHCPSWSSTPCTCSSSAPVNNYCPCANQPGAPCPCANDPSTSLQAGTNVARSSENHVLPTGSPNLPGVPTYHTGPYDVQTSCDCYCCPCNCPVSFSSENPPCSCKPEVLSSCTCKRTEVHS